jgi:GxxExxY protein
MNTQTIRTTIKAAVEVFRQWGPDWPPGTYLDGLCWELRRRGLAFQRRKPLPEDATEARLDAGGHVDLLIDDQLVVEIRHLDHVYPIHENQVRSLVRAGGWQHALLFNFGTQNFSQGIHQFRLPSPDLDVDTQPIAMAAGF